MMRKGLQFGKFNKDRSVRSSLNSNIGGLSSKLGQGAEQRRESVVRGDALTMLTNHHAKQNRSSSIVSNHPMHLKNMEHLQKRRLNQGMESDDDFTGGKASQATHGLNSREATSFRGNPRKFQLINSKDFSLNDREDINLNDTSYLQQNHLAAMQALKS